MATGPAARSMAELRKQGFLCQLVERWNPHARVRVDLWGFGDIIALDSKPGSLLVQATTTGNMSARIRKICVECADAAEAWLRAGNRISVHGWSKRGPAGKRKLWLLRRHDIELPEVVWRRTLQ